MPTPKSMRARARTMFTPIVSPSVRWERAAEIPDEV